MSKRKIQLDDMIIYNNSYSELNRTPKNYFDVGFVVKIDSFNNAFITWLFDPVLYEIPTDLIDPNITCTNISIPLYQLYLDIFQLEDYWS
jgi:hypothetical protein